MQTRGPARVLLRVGLGERGRDIFEQLRNFFDVLLDLLVQLVPLVASSRNKGHCDYSYR